MKKFIISLFLILTFSIFTAKAEIEIDISNIAKQLDKIETLINQNKISSKEISEQVKVINGLQTDLNQTKAIYQQKKENIEKKLEALGEISTNASTEATDIAKQRQEFIKSEEQHKAKIAKIELLNTKIDEINTLILKVRNQSILNRILIKDISIFKFDKLKNSVLQLGIFSYDILKSPYSWYKNLSSDNKKSVNKHIWSILIGFSLILFLAFYLSLRIRKKFGYKECSEEPSYLQKIQSNIAMIFSFGIIPCTLFGAFIIWLKNQQILLNDKLGQILYQATIYLLIFFIIRACVKVIFVPKCSYWRIIKIDDYKARLSSRLILFWSILILTSDFLFNLSVYEDSLGEVSYLLKIINIFTKSLGTIFVSRSLLYNKNDDITQNEPKEDYPLSVSGKISLFISFTMLACMFLALIGYVNLSDYIINNFIVSIFIIIFYQIINLFLRYLLQNFFKLEFLSKTLRVSHKSFSKIVFWLTLMLNPLIFACTVITVLGIWGFSIDIMLHKIKNFLNGFNIGDMHISITSVLIGILSFLISMFLFKSLKNSLLKGSLSKIDMEEGSRSSLASSIGLIGFIVSSVVAIMVMGGSLSNITLIAGALSFGIGLGLQNIVNNFVSGIIIIFEKPIKIGDWVVIKGQEGIVKTISMRATLLEAFDKSNIIIPNSEILSSSLINRTYSARVGLISIAVNIKYDADIKYVEDTLIEIASSTMGILTSPSPSVSFSDMTEKYLIFKLNCYTENIYSRQNITNQLRSKILEDFTKNKILWIS